MSRQGTAVNEDRKHAVTKVVKDCETVSRRSAIVEIPGIDPTVPKGTSEGGNMFEIDAEDKS